MTIIIWKIISKTIVYLISFVQFLNFKMSNRISVGWTH